MLAKWKLQMLKNRSILACSITLLLIVLIGASCSAAEEASRDVELQSNASQEISKDSLVDSDDANAVEMGSEPEAVDIFDPKALEGLLAIHYLNLDNEAGKHGGDAIIIQSPDGKAMMIDSGISDMSSYVLDVLEQLDIEKLDAAVNTHIHSDHIGGFPDIMSSIKIDQFYMPHFPDKDWSARTLYQIAMRNIPLEYLEAGDTFALGEELEFKVLNPGKGELPEAIKTFELDEVNDRSLVLMMTFRNKRFLFTGDITIARQLNLMEEYGEDLQADFMDAPHHGYSDAFSSRFVRMVSPEVAVVSVNRNPNYETMLKYKNENIDLYSTAMHGTILITSDGSEINVLTEISPN